MFSKHITMEKHEDNLKKIGREIKMISENNHQDHNSEKIIKQK